MRFIVDIEADEDEEDMEEFCTELLESLDSAAVSVSFKRVKEE